MYIFRYLLNFCCSLLFHYKTNDDVGNVTAADDSDDDLYSFIHKPTTANINQVLIDQLAQYLSSSNTTTDCLSSYPAVKAFIKANSTLPSSAAVERLFSAAGQILCSRRCKLSDDMIDKVLFRDRLKKLLQALFSVAVTASQLNSLLVY